MTSTASPTTSPAPVPPASPSASPVRTGPTDVVVDLRQRGLPVARVRPAGPLWTYDLHGLLRLGSAVPLWELESFRTETSSSLDIEIRRGDFGNRRARTRPRVTQYAARPAVSYEEHLGRAGSDFLIEMDDAIKVTVGPLLVACPQVLYTNVVEALLRFVLVSRDRVLLHSACLDMDGHGVLLSARTETGRTGTVLRLLREGSARFLSDDMTILSSHGCAQSFPKPVMISQATLRAVDAADLSPLQWRWLRVQSRFSSREGRGIAARLGERNLPIMSLDAVAQHLFPTLRYPVQRLVPCETATKVSVSELFVLERGADDLAPIPPDSLVHELIEDTDNAYGFPPFRYFAPALEIGGAGYDELRARERCILAEAMRHVRAHRLTSPDFSWAARIAQLTGDRSGTR